MVARKLYQYKQHNYYPKIKQNLMQINKPLINNQNNNRFNYKLCQHNNSKKINNRTINRIKKICNINNYQIYSLKYMKKIKMSKFYI